MPPPRSNRIATALLLLVTAAWGSTFFLIHDLVETVPSADFLVVRFGIAAAAMLAIFWRQVRALTRRESLLGLAIGALYGCAQMLQTIGLEHTPASVSGFITGMYVVLTPLLGALLLRERPTGATWAAVALSTAGLAVLSLRGLTVGIGEGLTLASAVLYAVHILALGRWSTPAKATGLAAVQALGIVPVAGLASLPGGLTLPADTGQWASLLYMALVAGAFALWAQTYAQARISATRAAIIMTMEPVFAALFAVLLGGEPATARMLLGGGLVLAAMYLVELRATPRTPGAAAEHEPPEALLHHEV